MSFSTISRLTHRRVPALLSLLLLGVLLLASACRKEGRLYGERKPLGKVYHSFTARYNGYFNANELLVEAEDQLEAAEVPDYSALLAVYPAYASTNAASAAPLLDKSMEKVSLVVNIHRPSNFEDDAYLLLGRAQLLKQDFEAAEHTFEYSAADFAPENEAARLKRIEKKRIADEKKQNKEAGVRNAPQRRKSSPARRRSSSSRKKSTRGKSSSRKKKGAPTRGASQRSKPNLDDGRSAPKARQERAPKQKRKTQAEMAKEQREERLAAEKAALKEEQRIERDAEREANDAAYAAEKAKAASDQKAADDIEAEIAADAAAADALTDGKGLAPIENDEKRPKHGVFIHETANQDFEYWMARTYIARERYIDAERILGKLARNGSTWKRIRRMLPATYADMYLQRGQLKEAVPYLEDAVALTKDKRDRARYAYVLGQVQQRLGNPKPAIASFQQVVKLKPAFDMAFNAQLNLLTTGYKVGENSAASTQRELKRMAKEDKYDLYRDQIYYEMADIALSNGDREEGIGYMRESLAANAGNARQAARGFRRLADLYFEDEDFMLASNYYDSTLQVLPSTDPSYATVTAYRDNLKPIAINLAAVQLQDSLLTVAAMDPKDQRQLAVRIDRERREAELAAAIARSRQAATQTPSRNIGGGAAAAAAAGRRPSTQTGGTAVIADFFAYDSKAVRRGAKDFARTWGERQLVDNWRTLSSRESLAAVSDIDSLQRRPTEADDADIDALLADVPNSPEAALQANTIIENALIALGRDYRDKLQNAKRASEALQELLRRYPETAYGAEAMYLLALAYEDLGQTAAATAAREQLKRTHPDTKFARSLSDPAFFDEARGAERALVEYYDQTYQLFQGGQAEQARTRLTEAPGKFGSEHALMPRFALLTATVAGKIDGREAYTDALKSVVATYPSSDEAVKAKDILRLLGERVVTAAALDQAAETNTDGKPSDFEAGAGQPHYFLAVLPKGANMSESRIKVSDYNGKYHRLDKLAVSNVSMVSNGEQMPVIVIRRFDDDQAAMKYYRDALKRQSEVVGGTTFQAAIISQNNYREVLRNKSFGEYLTFFAANYR